MGLLLSANSVCTCGLKVWDVDKWVRMLLIGGLNDEDTKQEVLSKVDEMPLDETITFVEPRETGKTALKILGGKLTGYQSATRKGRSEIVDRRAMENLKAMTLGRLTAQHLERNARNEARKDTLQRFVRRRMTRKMRLCTIPRRRQQGHTTSPSTG